MVFESIGAACKLTGTPLISAAEPPVAIWIVLPAAVMAGPPADILCPPTLKAAVAWACVGTLAVILEIPTSRIGAVFTGAVFGGDRLNEACETGSAAFGG